MPPSPPPSGPSLSLIRLAPALGQISLGAILGFAAGYAVKVIGKIALVVVGILFVALQLLAAGGYLQINWLEVQRSAAPLLTQNALQADWSALLATLTHNLPFSGAFVVFFILGLRRG